MLNCLPEFNSETCFLQAFAWFSDLLVEHAEIFWSLFAVDMDQVLAEQPPDTWDSFPLFQILNDYLRTDGYKFYQDIKYLWLMSIAISAAGVTPMKEREWMMGGKQAK
ncbi:Calcium-dependent secretion activator [Portunus trituberculatus]|uniref:Calcium-dependent secretion activator n=1 Tax=Portunus trituberculatus TaxID=210409 RepID=A0A5B7IS69_PORTR|nr:Calcium-dependent secretion activator [Portunus trituberculatus]